MYVCVWGGGCKHRKREVERKNGKGREGKKENYADRKESSDELKY